jgi:hypothetical protein
MSMPQEIEHAEPKRRGRKLGGHNKPGHGAGRPRKSPKEEFPEAIWNHGRATVSLTQEHIDDSMRRNSSHCAGVAAIKEAVPDATFVCLDLQSWRLSRNGCRYVGLTPHILQDFLVNYDQGNAVSPITFTLKPAFITRSGRKTQRHTPTNDELKDVGLRVADEQPHISSATNGTAGEQQLAENWKPESPGPDGALVAPIEPKKRGSYKRREPRAKISHTKPDGSIPTTLGGKLPPVSVLARREFGLRQVRR